MHHGRDSFELEIPMFQSQFFSADRKPKFAVVGLQRQASLTLKMRHAYVFLSYSFFIGLRPCHLTVMFLPAKNRGRLYSV